jgi:hypothetical protein
MIRRIVTAFALVVIALSSSAQEKATERFVIERIDVRNTQHVSPAVLIAETAIREGKEYSEEDVRVGVARLNRLPFILSANFVLEKGTVEGRRVLVVNVTEMKRLSFLVDARGLRGGEAHRTLDYDYHRPGESNDAASARWLAGGSGMLHVTLAVQRERQSFMARYTAWEIGYTRYNLFGTGAFATFNIRTPVDSVNEKHFSPQVALGIPLTTSQTLTFEGHDTAFFKQTLHPFGTEIHTQSGERVISFAWTYDTTDQPFAPSRGTLLRVAPVRRMADVAAYNAVPLSTSFAAYAEHSNTNGVDFAALHYWKLSEVNTVLGGVVAGWANLENRIHQSSITSPGRSPKYEIAQFGYLRDLGNGGSKGGSSRLELEARFRLDQLGFQSGDSDRNHAFEMSASWVRRSVLGTLRLGLTYER